MQTTGFLLKLRYENLDQQGILQFWGGIKCRN